MKSYIKRTRSGSLDSKCSIGFLLHCDLCRFSPVALRIENVERYYATLVLQALFHVPQVREMLSTWHDANDTDPSCSKRSFQGDLSRCRSLAWHFVTNGNRVSPSKNSSGFP